MGAFPSLTDSDGWQVVTQTDLERDPDEDLGPLPPNGEAPSVPLGAPIVDYCVCYGSKVFRR